MYNNDELKNIVPQPIIDNPGGLRVPHKGEKTRLRKIMYVVLFLFLILSVAIVSALFWYNGQLSSKSDDTGAIKKFTIESGSTSSQIGKELESQGVIRSAFVFEIYSRLSGKNNQLKAGTYTLSPSESVPEIFDHFVTGSSLDQFTITFLPGATLEDNKKVLKKAGFGDDEINKALEASYDSPLFADKPETSDLEGYIFGETYNFSVGVTVDEVLDTAFEEFYQQIQDNNLEAGFEKHDLNLFEAITLASIIQREVNEAQDQRQVAQVFYSRLNSGMALGSDVTYQYIADKTGVERDPGLDSPYNTRKYPGLPPGPISSPGINALKAVANPTDGDYLYFLSGDDNITYFAKTYAEHEANIANHCKVKCSTP